MQPTSDILRKAEIFGGLDATALDLLASVARRREISAGTYLYRQGDYRRATYVIVEGRVEVGRDREPTLETLIVLGPGDALAEGALLHLTRHTTSARALTPLTVLELEREATRARLA